MPDLLPHFLLHVQLQEQIRDEKDPEVKKALCLQDVGIFDEYKKELSIMHRQAAENSMYMGHLIGEDYPLEYYMEKRASVYQLSFPSFKTLAVIYEKEGDYDSAIKICEMAIKEGLNKDGTKGGMTARLEKLKAKKAKEGGQ